MKFQCIVPISNEGRHTKMKSVEAETLEKAQQIFVAKFDKLVGKPTNRFQGVDDGGQGRRNDHEAIRSGVKLM